MYSLVLMAALSTGSQAPGFFPNHPLFGGGYHGCAGCCGGTPVPVYGYGGCHGYSGCMGGYSGISYPAPVAVPVYGGCAGLNYAGCTGYGYGYGHGFALPHGYSYYGTCDGGCWGVGHSWMNHVPALPPLPSPKEGDKQEPEKLTEPPQERDKPERGGASVEPNRARVVVNLPADARLYIDDAPTRATSEVRTFRTPELRDGETYYYVLRAEIDIDGRPVALTKRVVLRPGEEVHATFEDPRTIAVTRQR
jgi:uncharacterized protein (TIGR03000 family)